MCTFFIANAYYQIKCNEELTQPKSAAYQKLEQAEESTYEQAKFLRQELLSDVHSKACTYMDKVHLLVSGKQLVKLPDIEYLEDQGGIEVSPFIVIRPTLDLIGAIQRPVVMECHLINTHNLTFKMITFSSPNRVPRRHGPLSMSSYTSDWVFGNTSNIKLQKFTPFQGPTWHT